MTQLAEWLKTTIPGIVVLGAIGSLVAIAALAVAKRAIEVLAPRFKEQLKLWLSRLLKPIIKELVMLYLLDDSYRGQAYFTYQLAKFVTALFTMVACVSVFVYAASLLGESLVRWAIVLPTIIFFLALYSATHCFLRLWVPVIVPHLGQYIDDAEKEAITKFETERRAKGAS